MRTPPDTGVAPTDTRARTAGDGDELPEPTYPYPPRHWWLKRLALAGVALLLLLAAARVWWGLEAGRRLQRELGPVVARGESVRPAEFNPPATVPDARNAAFFLTQAHAAINAAAPSPANSSPSVEPEYPPYPRRWHRLADRAVAANGKAFPLVRRARACDPARADWGLRYRTPTLAMLLPHVQGARELANLVADAAVREHLNGDDAAALELIRDVRHIGRTAEAHPMLVCLFVSVGIESLAVERLHVIASGLTIAGEGTGESPAGQPAGAGPTNLPSARPAARPRPASRSQVRALIRELLDESDLDASAGRALAVERMFQLDTADWVTADLPLIAPMFELDKVRMLRDDEVMFEAAAQPDWPAVRAVAARRTVPAEPQETIPPLGIAARGRWGVPRRPIHFPTAVSSALLHSAGEPRWVMNVLRLRSDRRTAAVSLAALVPDYLPAVPADPFAAGGRPFGYLLARGGGGGGDRPVVYGVGENGTDDTNGNAAALPPRPVYSWWAEFEGIRDAPDQWRDLSRWAPPPPPPAPLEAAPGATGAGGGPSTEAADDQADVPDDPGEDD